MLCDMSERRGVSSGEGCQAYLADNGGEAEEHVALAIQKPRLGTLMASKSTVKPSRPDK